MAKAKVKKTEGTEVRCPSFWDKNIIGLDLSLTSTGWAALDGKTAEITFGTFKSGDLRDLERLDWIRIQVRKLVEAQTPCLAICEDFAFARANQAHQMGGLGYTVRLELWRLGVPFLLVAPMTLKKFITGKGNTEKDTIMMELLDRFHVKVTNNNEADAVGLAKLGRAVYSQMPYDSLVGLILPQREVVRDLRKKYHIFDGEPA